MGVLATHTWCNCIGSSINNQTCYLSAVLAKGKLTYSWVLNFRWLYIPDPKRRCRHNTHVQPVKWRICKLYTFRVKMLQDNFKHFRGKALSAIWISNLFLNGGVRLSELSVLFKASAARISTSQKFILATWEVCWLHLAQTPAMRQPSPYVHNMFELFACCD